MTDFVGLLIQHGLHRPAAQADPQEAIVAPLGTWTTDGSGNEVGWRFTVGANPISVTHLLFHNPDSATEQIRIYRWSDDVVMAQADVAGAGADAYGETQLGTPVELAASTDYICTSYATPGRTLWFDPTTATVNAALAYVQSYFGSGPAKPTGASARDYWSPSFRFEVL